MKNFFTFKFIATAFVVIITTVVGINSLVYRSTTSFKNNFTTTDASIPPAQPMESADATGLSQPIGGAFSVKNQPSPQYADESARHMPYPEPGPYPYPGPDNPPISDTREFLKTDYDATIKTRHVQDIGRHIQTMIRGYDGRIDSASLREEYGNISFVIPKKNLADVSADISSLVGNKFIIEGLTTQNMLSQKRAIEDATVSNSAELKNLEAKQTELTNTHTKTLQNLNFQLSDINHQIFNVNQQIATTENKDEIVALTQTKNNLLAERARLQNLINQENQNYNNQLSNLKYQIDATKQQLSSLAKQDKNVLDTVETVRGNISLEQISIWGVLDMYVGGYGSAILVIPAIILLFAWHRHRHPVETVKM